MNIKMPTREELKRQLRANQEAMQERAMANLLEAVEFLSDRANSPYYEPTDKILSVFTLEVRLKEEKI